MSERSRQLRTILCLLSLAIALTAFGCGGGASSPTAPAASPGGGTGGGGSGSGGGGGGGGGSPPTPETPTGTLAVLMTDAPIEEILELNVFIAELKVKPAGGPVERFASAIGVVDLLTLQGGTTMLLGQDPVATGTYQFIELLLDQDLSSVVEKASPGEPLPLKIPSQKIKIAGGPFEVLEDGTTTVLVDFDAEKSLKKTGNGRYQLKPFVTVMGVTQSSG